MKRRTFLGLAAASGAAKLVLATPGSTAPDLRAALVRAQAKGKPLLILPIGPDMDGSKLAGLTLGQLLGRGSDEDVALLALCEFQALAISDLQAAVTVGAGAAFVLLDKLDSPRVLGTLGRGELDPQGGPEPFVAWLHKLLTADLAQASQQCAELWYVGGLHVEPPHAVPWRPRAEETDRAAAMLYEFALENQDQRARWMGFLAQSAAARLWDQDPPGAKWVLGPMTRTPQSDPCPACGMAFMPPRAKEFLDYYTK